MRRHIFIRGVATRRLNIIWQRRTPEKISGRCACTTGRAACATRRVHRRHAKLRYAALRCVSLWRLFAAHNSPALPRQWSEHFRAVPSAQSPIRFMQGEPHACTAHLSLPPLARLLPSMATRHTARLAARTWRWNAAAGTSTDAPHPTCQARLKGCYP